MSNQSSFSLLTEPWIRAETSDGDEVVLGIRDVFDGQHAVRRIRGESPAQNYAILRVLLAIVWRAHAPDVRPRAGRSVDYPSWVKGQLKSTDEADDKVLNYLDRFAGRFDLLDHEQPFMQVADLKGQSGQVKTVFLMVPESQEGSFFTMRTGDGRVSLELAEAARWLVYIQAFDYSGTKTGAVGDPRVKAGKGYPIGTGWTGMTGGTVVLGNSLRETLILNSPLEALQGNEDRPVWERPADTARERVPSVPTGPADLATWQSRRIRLHTNGRQVTGVVVCNGDRIPDAGANILLDPMTPYHNKNQSKKGNPVYCPRPYGYSRMMWRSLEPLISMQQDPGFKDKKRPPIRPKSISSLAGLREVGVVPELISIQLVSVGYGPKSSSVAETIESQIELPADLLTEGRAVERRVIIDCATATHDAAVALGTFAGMLGQAAGAPYEFQPAPTESFLAEFEPEFKRWIAGIKLANLDAQVQTWRGQVRQGIHEHASVLMRGAGPKALVGRVTGEGGNDAGKQLVTAGTAFRWLHNRLSILLPLESD